MSNNLPSSLPDACSSLLYLLRGWSLYNQFSFGCRYEPGKKMRLHHQFPLFLSCRDILRWLHPRIHSLFIHLPVTFVLAFSGLGVLMMQDILIPVYYTITNDSFHLNFIITNDSFLNFFPKFPVWECQVFLSRYLTIHNAVCISQNRFGFYSNNWRKVLCLCLCLCFYYIQAREKKIWQIT